jgi:hypothetical protein
MPQGVVQVAVVGALNVGGAVIFTALNEVLSGAFETPDAVAQELAATGDPVRAVDAGANTASEAVTAAGTAIGDSAVTAANNVRAAAGQSSLGNGTKQIQRSSTTTTPARVEVGTPRRLVTTKHFNAEPGSSHPLRDVVSKARQAARSVMNNDSERPHRTIASISKGRSTKS